MNEAPASTTPETATAAPVPAADADLDFDRWIETQQAGKPAAAAPETPAETPADTVSEPAATEAAAETPAAETTPEAAAEEPEPDPASEAGRTLARHKSSLQARIDQATARQRDAERERDAERIRRESLEREIAALRGPEKTSAPKADTPPAYVTPATDPEPKLEDFQDQDDPYAAWNKATARWATRDEQRKIAYEREQTAAVERARIERETADRQTEQVVAQHTQRLDAFRKTHPDFDAVIANPDAVTNDWISEEIATREDGPAIAYYLGKHPQESRRLAALNSQKSVIREIGGIAHRLGAASTTGPASQTTSTTSAPRPPKPVGASASALARDPADMSTDEYIEHMNREERRRHGG
jgi:hypothetical protein